MHLSSTFTREFALFTFATILGSVNAACLSETSVTAGVDDGAEISNYAEIAALGASGLSVNSFTTCKDSKGNLAGIQYTLNTDAGMTELKALGDMTQTCQKLTLSGPIESVRASYAPSDSSVSAIKYFKGGNSKTYGTLLSSFKEWQFSETNVLLGIHGRQSGGKITNLGFVSYDSVAADCPDPSSTTDATTDTSTPDTTSTTTETALPIVTETETGGIEQAEEEPKNWTVIGILAGLGIIVFLQIVCIICACTYKKAKGANLARVQVLNDSENSNRFFDSNAQQRPSRADYSVSRKDTDGFETNANSVKPKRPYDDRRKSNTKKQLADIDTIEMNDGGEVEMKRMREVDNEAHDTQMIASAQNRNESSSSRSHTSDAQQQLDNLVNQMRSTWTADAQYPKPHSGPNSPTNHQSRDIIFD